MLRTKFNEPKCERPILKVREPINFEPTHNTNNKKKYIIHCYICSRQVGLADDKVRTVCNKCLNSYDF
jgi:hypothetical protein